MHTKHFTNDKHKLACVSCMRFNVCARIIVKVHKYYSIIYVHKQKMYCSYGNTTKSVTYKPQIHQSMKEKHLICILNIKSRFNHEYLWSHFRNAVLTALIRHSESKITAVRSRTFSMCMCVCVCVCVCVCILQQAPCNDMLLNSCVEKWFCEVWKSIGFIMYNQQPTVV